MIETPLGDRHTYVVIHDRVSYIKQELLRPGKNGRTFKIKCLYIAFGSYDEAMRYKATTRHNRVFWRSDSPNKPIRSVGWDHELKIQGDFARAEIEAIAANIDKFFPVAHEVGNPIYKKDSLPAYIPGYSSRLTASRLNYPLLAAEGIVLAGGSEGEGDDDNRGSGRRPQNKARLFC